MNIIAFCLSVLVPSLGVIRVPAVPGLADRAVRVGWFANSQNTDGTDYTETTRISGVHIQGWCLPTVQAFACPCWFRPSGLIRVPAVSGLADRAVRDGKIANRQNTEATDYTKTTRISVCMSTAHVR